MGFIKNMKIEGGHVAFDIELTTPACPVKDLFKKQAAEEVKKIAGVTDVIVNMTSNVKQGPHRY